MPNGINGELQYDVQKPDRQIVEILQEFHRKFAVDPTAKKSKAAGHDRIKGVHKSCSKSPIIYLRQSANSECDVYSISALNRRCWWQR